MMERKLLFTARLGTKFMCCGALWFISGSRSRSRRSRHVNRSTAFKASTPAPNLTKSSTGGCSTKEFAAALQDCSLYLLADGLYDRPCARIRLTTSASLVFSSSVMKLVPTERSSGARMVFK